MMWYGIRGMMYVYQFKAPRRYMLTFGLCSMVGLGSLLFHGTLKFTTQMMDGIIFSEMFISRASNGLWIQCLPILPVTSIILYF
jgi:hypothetical protein